MKKIIIISILFLLNYSASQAADLEKGKSAYNSRCSSCHGSSGLADGVVTQSLPAGTVTNLLSGPFKFATDVEKVKELVKKGGAGVGLNPMMPPAPTIEDSELSDLAEFVMSLRKK